MLSAGFRLAVRSMLSMEYGRGHGKRRLETRPRSELQNAGKRECGEGNPGPKGPAYSTATPYACCSVCRTVYGFPLGLVAGTAAMDHDGCQNAPDSVHVNQASVTPCYFVNRAVG